MKVKIEFSTDNAAFDDWDTEVKRVLRGIVKDIISVPYAPLWKDHTQVLRDVNGNRIGTFTVEGE